MVTPPEQRKSAVPKLRINRMIRGRDVRVIGPDGEHLGIVPVDEALAMATSRELDLVEVSPPYDPSGNTALTGANLLFEMLCVLPGVKRRA